MTAQTVVVIGATGLIGNLLVEQLLADDAFATVRILVRKPVLLQHSKLDVCVVDFSDTNALTTHIGQGDSIFCCIGTTMNQVKGDKIAYRNIDYTIPLTVAQLGKKAGFSNYLLVSALGANAQSANFYLRLKGEVELAIAKFGFESFAIFQPSLLLGNRKEPRLGEIIFKNVFKLFSKLLIGTFSKYKAIEAKTVANAMVTAAKTPKVGTYIYLYGTMR